MADLLIKNGIVVTLDAQDRVLMDGAIAVEGSRIVAIGETPDLSRLHKADRVIDARGKAVLPGIVNVHTHVAAPIFRAYIEGRLALSITSLFLWRSSFLVTTYTC